MENLKILLVDDEEEFVTTLAERRELRGLQARVALNGEAALQMIETDTPQIVILDVMMPVMDGLATLDGIQEFRRRDTLEPDLSPGVVHQFT